MYQFNINYLFEAESICFLGGLQLKINAELIWTFLDDPCHSLSCKNDCSFCWRYNSCCTANKTTRKKAISFNETFHGQSFESVPCYIFFQCKKRILGEATYFPHLSQLLLAQKTVISNFRRVMFVLSKQSNNEFHFCAVRRTNQILTSFWFSICSLFFQKLSI